MSRENSLNQDLAMGALISLKPKWLLGKLYPTTLILYQIDG